MDPGKGFSFSKKTTRKDITSYLKKQPKSETLTTKKISTPKKEIIFQESYCSNPNEEQYHSPSIINIKDTLLLVWFAGNFEGYFNHVKFSYYTPTTNKWSNPKIICQVQFHSIQNPVLFYHESYNKLFLFASIFPAKKGQFNASIICQTAQYIPNLNDLQWSSPHHINNSLQGFLTKHKPVLITDKLLVLPIYHSNKDNKKDYSALLWCLMNNKNILSSKLTKIPHTQQSVQPCLTSIKDLHYCFFRTRLKPKHPLSYMVACNNLSMFNDKQLNTPLINNNSGFDILHIPKPKQVTLIVFNEGIKFRDRHRLSIAVSYDLCKTISHIINIEPSLTISKFTSKDITQITVWKDAEFSYPSMIKKDNEIIVSYTFNRDTIKTISLDLDYLTS